MPKGILQNKKIENHHKLIKQKDLKRINLLQGHPNLKDM